MFKQIAITSTFLFLNVLNGALAEDFSLTWVPGTQFEDVSAVVGDKVIFNYGGGAHNVFLHADQSCETANSQWIGATPPTEYTFQSAGTYTFACQVSDHCSRGQIVTFNVAEPFAGETIALTWIPGSPFDDQTASIGDKVLFNYAEGAHNVYLHAGKSCETEGSSLVGTSPPTEYIFTEPGEYTFACQIGNHCVQGQIVTFTVPGDTEQPTEMPAPPTGMPTQKPLEAPSPPTPSPIAVASSTLSPVAAGANIIELEWLVTGTYEDMVVNLGDKVIFSYNNAHTLFRQAGKSCDFTGSTQLGGPGNSPVEFVFEELGDFTFACQVVVGDRSHCDQGQIITFTVVDPTAPTGAPSLAPVGLASTTNIDWRLGVTYDDQTVLRGSIAIFEFVVGQHNVFQHTDQTCDRTNSVLIADQMESPKEILFDELGTFTYACQVGDHCNQGMLITFNVVDELPPTQAPVDTQAPVPAPLVGNQEIPVLWEIRSYDDVAVNIGDTVIFNYDAIHDVHLHNDRSCSTLDSELIGSLGGAPASFTFTEEGEFTFACQQGTHCFEGQRITFVVGEGNAPVEIPSPSPQQPLGDTIEIVWSNQNAYEDMEALVGDSVAFTYQPNHNVFLHTDKSCDQTGSIQVGGNDASPATFRFEESGTFTFACQVGQHCEANSQIITFTVTERDGGNGSVDDTPSDDPIDETSSSGLLSLSIASIALALLSLLQQ